jgi:hypothetical protein
VTRLPQAVTPQPAASNLLALHDQTTHEATMAPENTDSLNERGRSLEDEFFRREDAKLLDKLRALKNAETTRDSLARATGITNKAVLDRLMELGIGGETAAALSVLPFVEVAWADGSIDAKERAALLELARTKGFAPGSTEHALLEAWLDKRPESRFFTAWTHLVQGLVEKLTPDQTGMLKSTLMERARSVANASGGVFGLGKVSASESAMLAKLEKAFERR